MQILINIDEEDYNNLIEQSKKYPPDMFTKIQNNIINGTPLSTHDEKTGKWLDICPMVVDGGLAKRIKCSECGDERLDYFISKRYCPNCGAKMEGESA